MNIESYTTYRTLNILMKGAWVSPADEDDALKAALQMFVLEKAEAKRLLVRQCR